MESFDHSVIAYSIYRAQAVEIKDIVLDMLRLNTIREASFLQEIRLSNRPNEYAYTSYDFLRKIACHTLFPHIPDNEADNIVKSDSFNVSVHIKPVNDKKRYKRKSSRFLLATLKGHEPEFLFAEYIGLSKKWFEKEDVPYLEDLIVCVDSQDVMLWRNYEKTLRESTKKSSNNSESYNPFEESSISKTLSEMFSKK